uniref:Uncharacterized protein n=1 Tax=viral metagenome TaxID=1070528 RepID=A0A6C0CCM8_9ZZZZ
MRCRNCFESIPAYVRSELCDTCRWDSKVTISTTNAKKKYMLTNSEIEAANLFCYEISFRYAHGFKYLVMDIEELAEKVFATIDDNDKRKQKYLKNVENDHNNRLELIDEMRESINGYLEENDLEPDCDTLVFIEEIIKRKYNADLDDVIGYVKRKIKLDNLINEHSAKFIKSAKEHSQYDEYIYDHSQSLTETFDEISSDINEKNTLDMRTKKTNRFIEEGIEEDFIDFALSLPICKEYTTQITCKIKFDTICKRLVEYVERKYALDEFIKDNIDAQYRNIALSSLSYKNYVMNLKCNFETTCDAITTQIDKRIVSDKKKTIVDSKKIAIEKKYPGSRGWLEKAISNPKIGKMYTKYLQKGGDIKKLMDDIKNIIIGFNAQKTKNIDDVITKLLSKNTDPTIYDNIKFNYLTGQIKFGRAKSELTYYKIFDE